MYHKINIARLSHAQIGKLLNGHRIRVKHGHGHEIHASEEQHKKIMAAHRKGAGCTMQFDPYQIDHHQHLRHGGSHGEGFLGDLAKGAVKQIAPMAIDAGANFIKNKIAGGALNPAGYGLRHHHQTHGEGVKQFRRGRVGRGSTPRAYEEKTHPKKGKGISKGARGARRGRGVLSDLAPLALNFL